MAESLSFVADRLTQVALELQDAVAGQEWDKGYERARAAARYAGQLLQRMSAMQDVFAEARAAAEVDRALKRVQ